MHDQDFMTVLASHDANDLSQCFLVKDIRTNGYSVGIFDGNDKPFLLMEDDEAFNDALVSFLLGNGVPAYGNIAAVERRL